MNKKQRTYECPVCHEQFIKYKSTQKVCFSVQCAMKYAEMKAQEKTDKEYRRETRLLKEKAKTRSQWMKEAQQAFNEYVRKRDEKEPCISCGRFHKGQWHAGHYLTVGANTGLRFHPYNNNKQCSACNNYLSGNIARYRIALVDRIGLEAVEWLEGPHEPQKWTIEDLKEIKAYYKEQTKLLRMRDE